MTFMTVDLESPHFQGLSDVLGFPEQRIFSRTNPEMMCLELGGQIAEYF